jgi:hypothetical protein
LECAVGAIGLVAKTCREKDFAYLVKFVSGADEKRHWAARGFEKVRRKSKKRGEGDPSPRFFFVRASNNGTT